MPPDDSNPKPETPSPVEDVVESSPEDARIAELMEQTIDVPVLASAVEQQQAADAADTLEALEEPEAADVLEQMDDDAAARALAEMEIPLAGGVVQDLVDEDLGYAARLLTLMAPDDAADLLQSVEDGYRERLLSAIPLDRAAQLRRLVGFDQESAGGMMTSDYLALRQDMTVAGATEIVRRRSIPEGVQHLPVVSRDGRLLGVVSLRQLLLATPETRVDEVMKGPVKAVRPDLDREQVAREFDRYDYAMLPVVDLDDRLLGIVTVDDVIDIIRAEHTEDVQRTVGAGAVEAVYSGVGEKFRGRFPWLAVSLMLTGLAAAALLLFHDLIGERPILAFLAAVIAPVVGNAGHQALAVTLRGIVLGEVRRQRVVPLIAREAQVGALTGLPLGLLVAALLAAMPASWGASWQLGLVAGGSLVVAMVAGTLAGAGVPLVMRRLGADPAHASAIVLILITDATSYTTFLTLSFSLAGWVP